VIIPDVNLLVYATMTGTPHHRPAIVWWQDALNGREPVGLAPVVVMGFVRISTNARIFDGALPTETAIDYVQQWAARPVVSVLTQSEDTTRRALDLLATSGAAGNLTTDAVIAAHALAERGTVYSNDSDFGRFPDVSWTNPLRDQSTARALSVSPR